MSTQHTITFLIIEVARLLRQRFETALARAGLDVTPGEARTLRYVSMNPGLRQAALAEMMSVEPMTLVGFLDRLENRGLVERSTDPTDRRAKLIRATKKAEPLIHRIEEVANQTRRDATSGLDRDEVEAVRSGLAHMRAEMVRVEEVETV